MEGEAEMYFTAMLVAAGAVLIFTSYGDKCSIWGSCLIAAFCFHEFANQESVISSTTFYEIQSDKVVRIDKNTGRYDILFSTSIDSISTVKGVFNDYHLIDTIFRITNFKLK